MFSLSNLFSLKELLPTMDALRTPPKRSGKKKVVEDEDELPLTPFCCVSSIPASFRYAIDLVPASTTHSVLARPITGIPLATCFLAYITNNFHNPHAPQLREEDRPAASNMYYAIVQLTTVKSVPVMAPKPEADDGRPITAPTASRKDKGMTGFTDVPLDSSPSVPVKPGQGPGRPTPLSSNSTSRNRAMTDVPVISKPLAATTNPTIVRYFVPVENSREATILDVGQRIKERAWKEISLMDAMNSLRLPSSGIMIGDGENWRELDCGEYGRCRIHKDEWEMKVWVNE